MRCIFEFKCPDHGLIEALVEAETRTVACAICGRECPRILSTPRIALEGVSGDFPTATAAWGRRMTEKHRQADAYAKEHNGEDY